MQHAWGELWLGIGLVVAGAALAFLLWRPWFAEDTEYAGLGAETTVDRWIVLSSGLLIALIGIVLAVRAVISML
jgi:hypothetical protein